MNTNDATYDAGSLILNSRLTVVVDRPCKRNKQGGIHESSRRAVIAQARRDHPEFADAACIEIFYGTHLSTNTVLIFTTDEPVTNGF